MDYQLTTLSNGLKLLSVPLPSLSSVTLTVWVATGSRFETSKNNGVSHFLEHIVFKGSKKRPSARAISEAIDAIGAEFNAGTSKEYTNFYIRSHTSHIEDAFDVLSDMVLYPLIKKDDMEREKGVILEEIAMYEDTPVRRIGDLFEQLIFAGNPLAQDISGTKESVSRLVREDFLEYRKQHYFSQNMLITVAGGVGAGKARELAQKYFGDLPSIVNHQKTIFHSQLSTVKSRLLLHNKKAEQAHIILGFPALKRGSPQRYALALLTTIMGGNMSSRLFGEVREKRGLAYAIKTSADEYKDTGYLGTYEGVDVKRVSEAIKVTIDEHYKLINGKKKVTTKELTNAKEFVKGQLALALEDSRVVSGFFGEKQLLLGKIETPKEVFAKLEKVTLAEVEDLAKVIFKPQNLYLAVIGPYDDEEKFAKLI